MQQLPFRVLSQSTTPFAFVLLCSMPAPPHTPWLRSVILITFRLRKSSIWCVTCLGGVHQGSPEESARDVGGEQNELPSGEITEGDGADADSSGEPWCAPPKQVAHQIERLLRLKAVGMAKQSHGLCCGAGVE